MFAKRFTSVYCSRVSGSVHQGAFATRLADGLQLKLLFGIVSVDYCCVLSMGSSFVTCCNLKANSYFDA